MSLAKSKPVLTVVPKPADSPAYVLEEQIGHLLRRAHQRHTALFAEGIDRPGLTPTQYAALVKIGELGEVSQNHLGRMTAMDPATSQGVIRRLLAQGLIERDADLQDRRRMRLRLTDSGRTAVGSAVLAGRAITEATLSPLDARERAQFLALLKKLI